MAFDGSRGPPQIEGMTSLKVDNLTYRTNIEDLKKVFKKFGELGDIYVPRDRNTHESRGFAFIRFWEKRDAEDAMDTLDRSLLDGREIRVQMARYGRPTETYRPRRSSQGYGGRSGGGGGGGGGRYRSRSRSPRRRRSRHSRSRSKSPRRRRSSSKSPRGRSRSHSPAARSPAARSPAARSPAARSPAARSPAARRSRSRSGSRRQRSRSHSKSRSPRRSRSRSRSHSPRGGPYTNDLSDYANLDNQ